MNNVSTSTQVLSTQPQSLPARIPVAAASEATLAFTSQLNLQPELVQDALHPSSRNPTKQKKKTRLRKNKGASAEDSISQHKLEVPFPKFNFLKDELAGAEPETAESKGLLGRCAQNFFGLGNSKDLKVVQKQLTGKTRQLNESERIGHGQQVRINGLSSSLIIKDADIQDLKEKNLELMAKSENAEAKNASLALSLEETIAELLEEVAGGMRVLFF
jgi:hypothetical protein